MAIMRQFLWIVPTVFILPIHHIKPILSEIKFENCVAADLSSDAHYNLFWYTNMSFTHAESPAWDETTQTLYWVDVLHQDVHALNYNNGQHRVKHINYGEVNVVVPVANSSRLLVGVRSEVYLMDWNKPGDAALRLVAALDQGMPDNILNEGKADARGRFWGGTKGPQKNDVVDHDEAALYSLEQPCYVPRVQLKPVTISNGLVWTNNNSVLYYIDSGTRKIEAFDFDLNRGHIGKRRTILDIVKFGYTKAIPDGMTIDKDGMLWVALMFDGSVIRINPDSQRIIEVYKLPVSRTTSVTWAGEGLDELIVTTSRRNMDAEALAREPLSGAVFILRHLGTNGVLNHKILFPGADNY